MVKILNGVGIADERNADTRGFTDLVFAVTALLAYRFIPRIRKTRLGYCPLRHQTPLTVAVERLVSQRADIINRVCEREVKVERFKARLPWHIGCVAILFLVSLLVFPRFIAAFSSGCAVLGGLWTSTTTVLKFVCRIRTTLGCGKTRNLTEKLCVIYVLDSVLRESIGL